MTSVWIICMESDDPICVHFVFKCKIINNAHILGEQSYMLLNISCLQLVFDPDDVSLWKTNISRLGTLCHHEKCRGFGLFLDDIFINWYFDFIGIFSKWYLQSCVDLGFWYNLDNFLSCHTCVCFLGLIGVLSNLYLVWFLKVLCMHIYYMYILRHAYFRWSNI